MTTATRENTAAAWHACVTTVCTTDRKRRKKKVKENKTALERPLRGVVKLEKKVGNAGRPSGDGA